MPQRLTDIDVDEISLVGKGANRRTFTLLKSDKGEPAVKETQIIEAIKGLSDDARAEVLKALDVKAPTLADLVKDMTDEDRDELKKVLAVEDKPVTADAIFKALADVIQKDDDGDKVPDNVERLVKKLDERLTKAEKEAADAKAELAKRDASEQRQKAIEIAKSFGEMGFVPDDHAEAIEKLRTADPDAWDAVAKVLAAANELVKQSELFKEVGPRDAMPLGEAGEKIEKLAEELRKSNSDLTPEQARVKIMQMYPDLTAQVLADEAGRKNS